MSPAPPFKRRRLASANHTLSQPFKSPLKPPLKPTTATSRPNPHTPSQPPPSQTKLTTTSTPPPPTPHPLRLQNPTTTARSPPSTAITALQHQHTSLLSQLSIARSSLDTYTQALRIESTSKDTELLLLISKWKTASRAAAEEVFSGARDKVNKMGGLAAWKEREKMGKEGFNGAGSGAGWGWDGGGEKGYGGEGGERDEDERSGREETEGDEREDRQGEEEKEEEEEDEDEGFTMDMMLRSLNIDVGVIGFDKEGQRWTD